MTTQQQDKYRQWSNNTLTTVWSLHGIKNISEIIMQSLPDGEMATHGRALSPKEKQQGERLKR